MDAVLGHDQDTVALLYAGVDQRRSDGEHALLHLAPGRHLPRAVAVAVMEQRAVAVPCGLTEENAGSGPVGYRFRVDTNAGDLSFGVYLTALMVSVNVPEGTLTVTLSPFLCPTRARPTGESTEIRPADGSLSTAPTR